MHPTLNQWLVELEEETEIVISPDVIEETRGNQVKIGFSEALLAEWGKESVTHFIESCCSLYKTKKPATPMWFYCWYDMESGHICVCAVQQLHGKLPFRCELEESTIDQVVGTIFSLDSGLFSKGKLSVWRQDI